MEADKDVGLYDRPVIQDCAASESGVLVGDQGREREARLPPTRGAIRLCHSWCSGDDVEHEGDDRQYCQPVFFHGFALSTNASF